jgi:hypothetical protein
MSVCPKIILLFGMVYLASSIKASSQEIHNVKAEQFQNEMFITYDILNALPSQVYLVKAECIIDNNTFNVSSATGNGFGRVNAGPSRQVIWEIGKDLKPIKSENVSFRIFATAISQSDQAENFSENRSRGMSLADKKFEFINQFTTSIDNYLEKFITLSKLLKPLKKMPLKAEQAYRGFKIK